MDDLDNPKPGPRPRVALLWRGDADARARGPVERGRFGAVFDALAAAGLAPEPCIYDEAFEAEVRTQLKACAAILVWVNPLQGGVLRRERLNDLLREMAERGRLVSGHPDVIAKLGVKSVVWRTRGIGWSGDARFYGDAATLVAGLADSLATGPRVLKQERGNDGVGVWRVEALEDGEAAVREARQGAEPQVQPLKTFLAERIAALPEAGGYLDQAWQPRVAEGMVRCYMAGDRLAGFGHHLIRALASADAGPGGPRLYSGPDDPRFQRLRRLMEDEWTPALLRSLGLWRSDLPLIWDADFLLGPREPDGADSYVLCEINASSVFPIPEEAPAAIARLLASRLDRAAEKSTLRTAG